MVRLEGGGHSVKSQLWLHAGPAGEVFGHGVLCTSVPGMCFFCKRGREGERDKTNYVSQKSLAFPHPQASSFLMNIISLPFVIR